MTKLFTFVFGLVFVLGLGVLFAYPTMWLVNYLFSPSLLGFVFGVPALNLWKAVALNLILASFRSSLASFRSSLASFSSN